MCNLITVTNKLQNVIKATEIQFKATKELDKTIEEYKIVAKEFGVSDTVVNHVLEGLVVGGAHE